MRDCPEPRKLTRRRFALAALSLLGAPAIAAPGREELLDDGTLPDLWIGNPDAKITIIEYASVTCPHCAAFHMGAFRALKEKYIDAGKVRFVLREFPSDPGAMAGFMLARCHGDADKRAQMLDLLFTQQRVWTEPADGDAVGALAALAAKAGMDRGAFETCLRRQDIYEKILRMRAHASDRFGVDSTPTFFVNGAKIVGNQPIEVFDRAIAPLLQ